MSLMLWLAAGGEGHRCHDASAVDADGHGDSDVYPC